MTRPARPVSVLLVLALSCGAPLLGAGPAHAAPAPVRAPATAPAPAHAPATAPAPARAPAPAPAGTFPVLRQGSRSAAVVALQMLLGAAATPTTVDGSFGPATARSVHAAQRSRGLVVDGVVGGRTWTALTPLLAPAGRSPGGAVAAARVLLARPASAASAVTVAAQVARGAAAGYLPAVVADVRAFQRRAGLAPDGLVGPLTWRALLRAAGSAPAPSPSVRPAVVLQPDGLGFVTGPASIRSFTFGSPAGPVRTALAAALGRVTGTADPECGQGPRTSLGVPGFQVLLDGDRFVGWSDSGRGPRLTTGDGLGVGSTLAQLRASLARVTVERSTLGVELSGPDLPGGAPGLGGLLTGTAPTATVTDLWAGETCVFR